MSDIQFLIQALESTGYPVAWEAFDADRKPEPPYIVYAFGGDNVLYADDRLYYYRGRITVTMVLARYSLPAIAKLRNALAGYSYRLAQNRNRQQNCYEITVTLEV